MMISIWRLVVLCALVATPALGSAISKVSRTYEDVKGGRLQTDTIQQSPLKSAPRLENQVSEQREEILPQQQVEEAPASPLSQLKEESPKTEETKRYEARPQVTREEISKAHVRSEQRVEERIEQLPQQRVEYDSQQVELKEGIEQQRVENLAEERRELHTGEVKGLVAPPGLAEPYAFSYQVEGSSRSESSDANGVVRGQYTIEGADGASRVVDYVADHNGFRASVNTNEFGTESKSAANVVLRTSQPNAEDITLRLEGKTREDLAAPVPAALKGAPPTQRLEAPVVKGPVAPLLPVPLPLPAVQAPVQVPVVEEVRPAIRAAKGERVAQHPEELELAAPIQTEQQPVAAPAKSAQLRAPKSLPSQTRAFESASAHRVYRGPVPAPLRPAPAVFVRRDQPGVLRGPVPAVYRGHAQRERYPPSPVQGYRRQQVALEPVVGANPRVSFYGPSAGFEEPAHFDHQEA